MSEQVEVAEPEKYHVRLYFNICKPEERVYYYVSSSHAANIVQNQAWGSIVTFRHRDGVSHIRMDSVYEVKLEAVKPRE